MIEYECPRCGDWIEVDAHEIARHTQACPGEHPAYYLTNAMRSKRRQEEWGDERDYS